MTIATINPETKTSQTAAKMFYQVAMPEPLSHLFEVTLEVKNWQGSKFNSKLNLKMPVWTPGSYLVREYSRQIQEFSAKINNKPAPTKKISKNHWQIETGNNQNITINYRVFANELTVRTNHLDDTHGYFNGAALFLFIPGLENQPIRVKIIPPKSDWQITTTLPKIQGETNTFEAKDFDTLVDSPFEVGIQKVYEFECLGKPHQWVLWGEGNVKPEKLIEDTKKIIEVEAKLYDGLPYEKYLFLLHLSASGFGGLEHKESCSLNYPRLGFRNKEKYNRFMQLVAHEFFHLWNVKRIRPKELENFDYEQENYTPSLWFCEGTTSYYDTIIPQRAGIYDRKTCLKNLSKDITKFLTIPGRKIQPLSESSFDAWIKLYRKDANSDNNQISYYLKGELVSLLLDLLIRNRHKNKRSLDNVMQEMWQRFGKEEIGFTSEELKEIIESVAETDLTDFFEGYIHGTDDLPFAEYLEPFGLHLKSIMEKEPFPYFGARVTTENGKEMINFVEADSPAMFAGIDPGDELLAIDKMRIKAEELNERLKDYQPGDTIKVTLFHQDELRTLPVKLTSPQPSRYEIATLKNPTEVQQQNLAGWLMGS